MSSVIKLGRNNKLKIKISNSSNYNGIESESEDEYLERLENEKREQIFNAGREEAIKELQANYTQNLHQKFSEYDNMMTSIEEQLVEYRDAFDKIVIDTSFLIASKIINKSITESPIITDTIKESTKKIIGANNIIFRLNPNDLALIKESEENFMENNSYSNLKFESDDRIDVGGCFVESEIGNVDARISSQLNELKTLLKQTAISEN
ncbi:MAG: FliH/SctL family protein [Melioribacteraceae bacterium]|jgi:flagellar assembly protein FliH|nr:FliH/SctL family protein [Melioribacteraceae bacterium]